MSREARMRRYCELMSELKMRLRFLESSYGQTLDGLDGPLTYETIIPMESVALQLRKALELIAYSSLLANEETASMVRPDFAEMRKAKRVLQALEKMNPGFFPQAVEIDPKVVTHKHLTFRQGDVFTKQEFAPLFDACSELLHVRNPFAPEHPILFETTPRDTIQRIRNLLQLHLVSLGADQKLLVQMLDWNTSPVHAAYATAL